MANSINLNAALQQSQEERLQKLEDERADFHAYLAENSTNIKVLNDSVSELSSTIKELDRDIKGSFKNLDDRLDIHSERLVKLEGVKKSRDRWVAWGRKIGAAILIALGGGLVSVILEYFKNH